MQNPAVDHISAPALGAPRRTRAGAVARPFALEARALSKTFIIPDQHLDGRYSIDCGIRRDRASGDMVIQGLPVTHFVVDGTAPRHSIVSLRNTIEPRSLLMGGS